MQSTEQSRQTSRQGDDADQLAARVISNGREVLIYIDALQEELSRRWNANARRCVVRLMVPGAGEVAAEAVVVTKRGKYYLYALGSAQQVLRAYYGKFRGGKSRQPLPVLIEEIAFA